MTTGEVVRPDFAYTHHLVALVGRCEAAAGRLAGAAPARLAEVAARARRESARLSARLDASPLVDATAAEVDAREAGGPPVGVAPVGGPASGPQPVGLPPVDGPAGGPRAGGGPEPAGEAPPAAGDRGGWARALKLDTMASQDIAAVEYANLLACFDAERDLAGRLFEDPARVLRALNAEICRGLVAPGAAGGLRRAAQAVHDGAHGQVIYQPPPPARLPGLLEALAGWLGTRSARLPALVVAGVVHGRILEWQPFEAASGRTARAAGRLVLRARGTDVHGLAVPERWLAADPLGYHREVAATIRRRGDLGGWLERFGEALCAALEEAAGAAGQAPAVEVPERARAFAAGLADGEPVTLSGYARALGVALPAAATELEALARAGQLRLEAGSHGLRFRRARPGGRPPGQA